ncbi:hypothetical protein [Nonomuraea typhae]|uniref:hypothetical protein n=1 Tax=Nonomuraea typhae TaxID=2603600 RepID=UPI0012FCF4FB|nr:hypothetical protein [Nonomuraea typhae]
MTNERFTVIRGEDLLVADVELINLVVDDQRLARADPGQPSLVVFHLPPQHVTERPVVPWEALPRPVPAHVSGPSRLAFFLDDDTAGLELSAAGLLDWSGLSHANVPRGTFDPDPGDPTSFLGIPRMAIEFPSRLVLTQEGDGTWAHRAEPFTAGGRTELWHTRLVPAEAGVPEVRLRAYARRTGGAPREGALPDDGQLDDILMLVNSFELLAPTLHEFREAADRLRAMGLDDGRARHYSEHGWPWGNYQAEPLLAERFLLSALGASVRIRGQWNYPVESADLLRVLGRPTPAVSHYHHITGLGRDQYVRVVERGYLSTGHRAAITTVSERQFLADEENRPVAPLVTKRYITVQEPEVRYGPGAGYPHEGREMPFAALRITNLVTPELAEEPEGPFWIRVSSGADHAFTMIGTDADGRQVTFTMPAVFVPASASQAAASAVYFDGPEERRTRPLHNQTMAPAAGGGAFPVAAITFGLSPAGGHPLGELPRMAAARIRVPEVEQLTGQAGERTVWLHDAYLTAGLDGLPSGAFLRMEALSLRMGPEVAGGIARPDAVVDTISSRGGVLAERFTGGPVGVGDLAAVFRGAKVLGTIELTDILAEITGGLPREAFPDQLTDALRDRLIATRDSSLPVPILRSTPLPDGSGVELRYLWKPRLRDGVPLLKLARAWLVLESRIVRGTDGAVATTVTGTLRDFDLDFAGLAAVHFDELTFSSRPGCKPDISARGVSMRFRGQLRFVDQLRSLLPANCFGDGSIVRVTPEGITAGYSVSLPSAEVGVFTLRNLALSALLSIPFDDRPVRLRFALSERHSPFGLTVAMFGGGGFFALEVGADGVELVEGALEFGGAVSLNLGVASGGVYVMGGVYFALSGDSVVVRGYLRCGGHLSVLGIVSVSVEFYLALEYAETGGTSVVRGIGSVTISVRVAFFSKSVTLRLERSFAGSPGDPTFDECVEPADWDAYCLAHAA